MPGSARTRLRRKLLRIAGVEVDFIEDPYLQMIADEGAPFADTGIRVLRGRLNECHRNAALFWLKGQCDAIAIGYYLGPDGVWRQHSWGVMGDGAILDTHAAGRQYLGIRVESMDAVKFAEDHLGVGEVLRALKKNPDRLHSALFKSLNNTAPHRNGPRLECRNGGRRELCPSLSRISVERLRRFA